MGNDCCRPNATRPAVRRVNVIPISYDTQNPDDIGGCTSACADDTQNPDDIGGCTSACSDGKSTARLSKLGLQYREITEDLQNESRQENVVTEDLQNESRQENVEQLKLILFGPVGSGKSALGNIITQTESFGRKSMNITSESYTRKIQLKTVVFSDIPLELVVIDTPGIQEYSPEEHKCKEDYSIELQTMMNDARKKAGGRNHLYVFVISLQQKLDPNYLNSIQRILHIIFDRFVIVVYTNFYNQTEDSSREQILQCLPWEFRDWVILNNVPHRFMNIHYTNVDTIIKYNYAVVVDFLKYCDDYVKTQIREMQRNNFSPFRNSVFQSNSLRYISANNEST